MLKLWYRTEDNLDGYQGKVDYKLLVAKPLSIKTQTYKQEGQKKCYENLLKQATIRKTLKRRSLNNSCSVEVKENDVIRII